MSDKWERIIKEPVDPDFRDRVRKSVASLLQERAEKKKGRRPRSPGPFLIPGGLLAVALLVVWLRGSDRNRPSAPPVLTQVKIDKKSEKVPTTPAATAPVATVARASKSKVNALIDTDRELLYELPVLKVLHVLRDLPILEKWDDREVSSLEFDLGDLVLVGVSWSVSEARAELPLDSEPNAGWKRAQVEELDRIRTARRLSYESLSRKEKDTLMARFRELAALPERERIKVDQNLRYWKTLDQNHRSELRARYTQWQELSADAQRRMIRKEEKWRKLPQSERDRIAAELS